MLLGNAKLKLYILIFKSVVTSSSAIVIAALSVASCHNASWHHQRRGDWVWPPPVSQLLHLSSILSAPFAQQCFQTESCCIPVPFNLCEKIGRGKKAPLFCESVSLKECVSWWRLSGANRLLSHHYIRFIFIPFRPTFALRAHLSSWRNGFLAFINLVSQRMYWKIQCDMTGEGNWQPLNLAWQIIHASPPRSSCLWFIVRL